MANNMVPPTMQPQQPQPFNPMAGTLPMPPVPPPTTGTGLGFSIWAQDPANAAKVVPSMTKPDTPLQPGAQASAQPPAQPFSYAANPPKPVSYAANPPIQQDQAELQRLQKNGAGLKSIQNPWLKGLAMAGDIAGSALSPGLAALIPGTTAHNGLLQRHQQGIIGQDQAAIQQNQQTQQAQAQLADTQAQTAQRAALGDKAASQSESYAPMTLSAEQAQAIGHPELQGQEINSKAYTLMLTGKQKTDSAGQIAAGKNETATTIAQGKQQTSQGIADAANKTKVLLQGMKDNTSQANTGARIAAKGQAGGGNYKVPADVTKRAALASNVLENADAVDQILKQHPEIVGATGGRYTNVQQMIGSNDPNIQALGVRMHNIALASNGAHGLRSAEAVAQTEKELFNNFKTGPQGISGALQATRGSVQTFLDDEKNYTSTGKRTGLTMPASGAPGKGSKSDPLGIR